MKSTLFMLPCILFFSFILPGGPAHKTLPAYNKAKPKTALVKKKTNITLSYTNSSIDGYGIQFYNTSTGTSYYFSVGASSSGVLGSIPEGYYDVTFSPYDTNLWHSYVVSCGYPGLSKTTITFSNILYDDICNYVKMS